MSNQPSRKRRLSLTLSTNGHDNHQDNTDMNTFQTMPDTNVPPQVSSRHEPSSELWREQHNTLASQLPSHSAIHSPPNFHAKRVGWETNSSVTVEDCPMPDMHGKLPDYLIFDNVTFTQMIQKARAAASNSLSTETLRQIAILIHHCTIIGFQKALWTIFLRSGTGTLNTAYETAVKYWPKRLQLIVREAHIMEYPDHPLTGDTCSKVVRTHLQHLDDEQRYHQGELVDLTQHVLHYHLAVAPIIRTFVQQRLRPFAIETSYEMQMIHCEYEDQRLVGILREQNVNGDQMQRIYRLCQRQVEYDTRREEMVLLRQYVEKKKIGSLLQTLDHSLSSCIEILHNPDQRQEWLEWHRHLIRQHEDDLFTTLAAGVTHGKKLLDDERAELLQDQRALPLYQQFNYIVRDAIEQRLRNMTKKVQTMYQHKMYRLFNPVFAN